MAVGWWIELKRRQKEVPAKKDDMPMWEEEGPGTEFINWGDALSDKYIDWFRS